MTLVFYVVPSLYGHKSIVIQKTKSFWEQQAVPFKEATFELFPTPLLLGNLQFLLLFKEQTTVFSINPLTKNSNISILSVSLF